jgi:hypothetical protein
MNVAVSTRAYNFSRSGANIREPVLTAEAVGTRGIKRLFRLETPDDKRGCDASPLIAPGVKLPDGQVHDLVLLATMGNWVYAFETRGGTLVWKRHIGEPVRSNPAIDTHMVNDHWGIVSTPVIHDGVMYGCAWISADGTPDHAQHFVFAINVASGLDRQPMISLEGVIFSPGHGLADIKFEAAKRKQRAALGVSNGALMIPFGTVRETSGTARGWIVAVDLASWKISASWCTTARKSGAGIWMAGTGPTVMQDGDLVFATGNGAFDGITDFGESVIRLRYTPALNGHAAQFSIIDWWTPWTDALRTGGQPEAHALPDASSFRKVSHLFQQNQLQFNQPSDDWSDMDLGSGGVVQAEPFGLLLCAGKDGVLYAMKATQMGKTRPNDLQPVANRANYGRLAFPPIFLTYFPPELDPAPDRIETLNVLHDAHTHHQHGAPIRFDSTEFGPMLFNWGENENGRAWQLKQDACVFLARTVEVASPQADPKTAGGMPGGMLTVSSNGAQDSTAILWACVPYGDANRTLSAGRLIAYAATRFANGQMVKLWDSQDWNHQFTFNKFGVPVVANGMLYLPTYDGAVVVYGIN